jgi:hypothetical protein
VIKESQKPLLQKYNSVLWKCRRSRLRFPILFWWRATSARTARDENVARHDWKFCTQRRFLPGPKTGLDLIGGGRIRSVRILRAAPLDYMNPTTPYLLLFKKQWKIIKRQIMCSSATSSMKSQTKRLRRLRTTVRAYVRCTVTVLVSAY